MSGRHINLQTLDDYAASGTTASLTIPGTPEAVLTIDAERGELRLEVAWDGIDPPQSLGYVHITTGVHMRAGKPWSVLTVRGRRFFSEAYPLVRAVSDLVQLKDVSFSQAVDESVSTYNELTSVDGRMPVREEIGLVGELLVLAHLVESLGPEGALASWRGGDQTEEHDFGLSHDDLEVKTTTSDTRRHWISSHTQLMATGGRPLWLVSIQLTGAGASDGHCLPDLVDHLQHRLQGVQASQFKDRIVATKFNPSQPAELFRNLRFRSPPAFYRVEGVFPRLDTAMLTLGGADLARVAEVSYTIRLDGLAESDGAPSSILKFGRQDGIDDNR